MGLNGEEWWSVRFDVGVGRGQPVASDCGVHVSVSVGVWAGPVGWVFVSLGVVGVWAECGRGGGSCLPILCE